MAIPGIYSRYDVSNSSSYPGTGVTLFDLSNTNDVTLTPPPYLPSWAGSGQTKYLEMQVFEGGRSENYFSTSGVELTINMWVRINGFSGGGYDCMLTFGPGYPGTYLYLWTDYASGQKYYFEMTDSTPINTGVTPSTTAFDNVIVSIGSSTMAVYVNGTSVGSTSHTLSSWPATSYLYLNQADTQGSSRQSDIDLPYLEIFETGLGSTAAIALYNSQVGRFVPAPAPPTPVLIGSYDFSDPACYPGTGNTAFDLTANNNDLVMNTSGAQPSYGGTGQSKAFEFLNDNNNYLFCSSFTDSGPVFGGSYFTLSAWHNYANSQLDNAAILFGGNGVNNDGVVIQVTGNDGNKIYGGFFGDPNPAVGIANTANTWHMSTLTGDGTTLKLYQDGALIGSTSQSGTWDGAGFVLGRYLNTVAVPVDSSPVGLRYAGLIGIAEVYSGALGSTDISDLYDLQQPRFYPAPPPPPPTPTPISELDFSNIACYPGTGNTVFDLAGSNDFSNTTGATFVSNGQASYFQFAGSGNKLQTISPVTVTSQTVFTFSAWAMATGGSSGINVVFGSGLNNPGGGVPNIALNVTAPNQLIASFGYGVGVAVGTNINQNEWYLLTLTCDGTTIKLYINDTLAGSAPKGTGNIGNNPTNFVIGQYDDVDTTIPWIGRVATYNYYEEALSLEEIQDLYDNTVNRFATPFLGIVGGRQFAQGFNG
jgi:hypothetical protein